MRSGFSRICGRGCGPRSGRLRALPGRRVHATIYWTGNAIASSIRTYANNNRYPWAPSHDRTPVIEAPTGITFVDYENPPGVNSPEERIESFLASDRAAWYNHVNIAAHPRGGHFIPWEIPEQWTADLVRTFKSQRR